MIRNKPLPHLLNWQLPGPCSQTPKTNPELDLQGSRSPRNCCIMPHPMIKFFFHLKLPHLTPEGQAGRGEQERERTEAGWGQGSWGKSRQEGPWHCLKLHGAPDTPSCPSPGCLQGGESTGRPRLFSAPHPGGLTGAGQAPNMGNRAVSGP